MQIDDYRRIEQALHYLERHRRRQPSLREVADSVRLSEFHFQRLFRRWAGVSPKRFLQYLTVEHAKALLEESRSVLETSYESGLSGPSRLHDLFVALEAVTPGEYRARGAGLAIAYGLHPSPFGSVLLATTDRGICALSFVAQGGERAAADALSEEWPGAELREDARATAPLAARAFDLRGKEGELRLHVRGTNFQIQVWRALLRIPPGRVASYEDVATGIGRPSAGRAVGSAIARNPVGYLIPCHRVIRKVGQTGEYRWGSVRKKAMLAWEAARSA